MSKSGLERSSPEVENSPVDYSVTDGSPGHHFLNRQI